MPRVNLIENISVSSYHFWWYLPASDLGEFPFSDNLGFFQGLICRLAGKSHIQAQLLCVSSLFLVPVLFSASFRKCDWYSPWIFVCVFFPNVLPSFHGDCIILPHVQLSEDWLMQSHLFPSPLPCFIVEAWWNYITHHLVPCPWLFFYSKSDRKFCIWGFVNWRWTKGFLLLLCFSSPIFGAAFPVFLPRAAAYWNILLLSCNCTYWCFF